MNGIINLFRQMYYNNKLISCKFKSSKKFIDFCLNQQGGKNTYSVDYNNSTYKFKRNEDDDMIILSSSDSKQNECVGIHIDKKLKIATIQSINASTPNCVHLQTKVGTHLLAIIFKVLKKYKEKLGINWIVLSDQSYLSCASKIVELSYLSVLTSGHTWYGKYGFRPIQYQNTDSTIKVIPNEYFLNAYNNNLKIMKITTINQIKWSNYIHNEKLLKALEKVITNNPSMLVKDFIKNILTDWDKNCLLLSESYLKLFADIGLVYTGSLYGLQI